MQQPPPIFVQVLVATISAMLTTYAVAVVQDERNRVPPELQRRIDDIERRCTEAVTRVQSAPRFDATQRCPSRAAPHDTCPEPERAPPASMVDGCGES